MCVGDIARGIEQAGNHTLSAVCLELEIADNVRVRVTRASIADVRSKGEPVKS